MDELINLTEFAQGLASSDPLASGMIEQLPATSDVLAALPFKGVNQGVNRFDRETSDPAVGFRALNEEPDISYGSEETFQDIVVPLSGLIEFDRIKLKRYGERKRVTYMKGQMKNGARLWTTTMIDGDNDTDPRVFTGLKKRCVADASGDVAGNVDDSRLMANSTASGGAPLSLSLLDRALGQVANPTHIICTRNLHTRFQSAARNPNLVNNRITSDYDSQLGRRVTRYGDVEFLTGYEPSKAARFLPFNEVAFGGGAAVTSSIYIVSMREDGLCGIQTSAPEYLPVDTDRGVFERDLFEWDAGITIEDFYSVLRLSSITDAAIVQ